MTLASAIIALLAAAMQILADALNGNKKTHDQVVAELDAAYSTFRSTAAGIRLTLANTDAAMDAKVAEAEAAAKAAADAKTPA